MSTNHKAANHNATNSDFMKYSNRRLIINIVRKKPVSRAELARITGLTRAAVTIIVEKLMKEGILFETGLAETGFGRKPILLDLNPTSYYSVGVSITRDGCSIGLMNIKGVLLSQYDVDLDSTLDVYEKIRILIDGVKKTITDLALPYERISGIGINAPGPVDIDSGTILNPPNFESWHHVTIVQEFKKHFDVPVFLENNSKSLAIAEKNYGKGSEFNSFMLMVVDSGIGAGFVINENIYRGFYGLGSEIGHVSIDFNGKQCNCGNKGCMEVYASIPSVIENIQRYDKNITTWNEIVDKALDGNVKCKKAIEKEALYLSAGIVNVMNILELEAVVLTGTIRYKPDIIMESIQKNVWKSMITRKLHKLIITNSSIVKNPGVVSAASIIFERFFKGEI